MWGTHPGGGEEAASWPETKSFTGAAPLTPVFSSGVVEEEKDSQTALPSLKARSSEGAIFSRPLGPGVGSPRATDCCVGGSKACIPAAG